MLKGGRIKAALESRFGRDEELACGPRWTAAPTGIGPILVASGWLTA